MLYTMVELTFEGFYSNGVRTSEYNVYSTFQSHEPEFDYLKSLEIEEKINQVSPTTHEAISEKCREQDEEKCFQIKWLKKKNAANFILSTNGRSIHHRGRSH